MAATPVHETPQSGSAGIIVQTRPSDIFARRTVGTARNDKAYLFLKRVCDYRNKERWRASASALSEAFGSNPAAAPQCTKLKRAALRYISLPSGHIEEASSRAFLLKMLKSFVTLRRRLGDQLFETEGYWSAEFNSA